MNGDKMYCKHCKRLFNDTWVIHDTRKEKKLITICPFCFSKDTINANQYVENYEKQKKHGFRSLEYSDRNLYDNIKKLLYSIKIPNVEKV